MPPSPSAGGPELPLPPDGWTVHEDSRGNFYYLTPLIARTGTRHKVSNTSHVTKLVEKGDLREGAGKSLVFKRSVFLASGKGVAGNCSLGVIQTRDTGDKKAHLLKKPESGSKQVLRKISTITIPFVAGNIKTSSSQSHIAFLSEPGMQSTIYLAGGEVQKMVEVPKELAPVDPYSFTWLPNSLMFMLHSSTSLNLLQGQVVIGHIKGGCIEISSRQRQVFEASLAYSIFYSHQIDALLTSSSSELIVNFKSKRGTMESIRVQTGHPLAQWGESKSCLVTASLQGGGGMVAAITSDREHFIHHKTGDAAICVISSSGDLVTVVSVSWDLVMHRGLITLESDHIQVDLRKKVLAVFCVKCETMSEGAVQHTSHYSRQHLASGVVKVCSREGCQQAFQTYHELREHRKD